MPKTVDEVLRDMEPQIKSLPKEGDPERIPEILALLQDLWTEFPDQRFYQLLYNAMGGSVNHPLSKLYNVADWQVSQALQDRLREAKAGAQKN